MKKIDEYRYKAEKGKFIIRKSDNVIMGENICLGDEDTIDNYKEKVYTKKAYKEFYEKVNVNFEVNKPKVMKKK